MSGTPPREPSPGRQVGSPGDREPTSPLRSSPPREPPGTPVTYGPPGFTPDPWVREGANPSATPNGGLSFEGVLRNPIGVSQKCILLLLRVIAIATV